MDTPQFASDVDQFYSDVTLQSILGRGDVESRRAAALALGMLGDHEAVTYLGQALSDQDRGVRLAADDSFRALLVRNAAPIHYQQLLKIMHLNDGAEYAGSLAHAMALVDQVPAYVEAHHQLAICWHGLENYFQASDAYQECLQRCEYHYPAWQGLARCQLLLGKSELAIESLEKCIAICPDVESARLQIRAIRRRRRQTDA